MYGRLLADGRGVTPDLEAARGWIARAAAAGLRDAQVALAEMLVNGRGGPRDTAAALGPVREHRRRGSQRRDVRVGRALCGRP
jgi:TPR repeat protein